MKKRDFFYWRYLRIIAVLLFLYPISVLAAQSNISVKGQYSLKEAIRFIEKNSEYTFFYKDSDLKDNSKRNINFSGTVDKLLEQLLAGTDVDYVIKDKDVIFKVSKSESIEQQPKKRVITGIIMDGDLKEPIIGASVWLKNSSSGAITDLNGRYTLTVEGIGGVIEFSYIGMKKQEVAIGNDNVINVTLYSDTKALEEVVVVGYGHQKKESVVGAISSMDVSGLNIPGANISNVLAVSFLCRRPVNRVRMVLPISTFVVLLLSKEILLLWFW